MPNRSEHMLHSRRVSPKRCWSHDGKLHIGMIDTLSDRFLDAMGE